jgi:hypothetical protein
MPIQFPYAGVLASRKAKKYGHGDRLLPDQLYSLARDKQLADSATGTTRPLVSLWELLHQMTQPTIEAFP